MARNGLGTYSLPSGNPIITGTTISSSTMNTTLNDIASALTQSISSDGQTPLTANLSAGGYKITGLGTPTGSGDALSYGLTLSQTGITGATSITGLQSQTYSVANAGGTADAITATYSPTITALTHGMTLYVRAGAANATTTPTFTPNSGVIAAKTIVKGAGSALAAGDIAGGGHWIELQYDLTLDKWVLLNPAMGAASTAPQFDNTTKVATTAFSWQQGHHFQNAAGIALTANTTLTVAQAGHWFETQATGLTITLPLLASCPAGMATYTIRALIAFTLKGNGSETINNLLGVTANTVSVLAGEVITVVGNGAGSSWYVIHEGMSGSLFTSSLGAQGYQKVGSTIIQRGSAMAGQSGTAYTSNFPIAFPTACRALVAQHIGTDATINIVLDSTTATQFALRSNFASSAVSVSYIAIGE